MGSVAETSTKMGFKMHEHEILLVPAQLNWHVELMEGKVKPGQVTHSDNKYSLKGWQEIYSRV